VAGQDLTDFGQDLTDYCLSLIVCSTPAAFMISA
jgi:hypothetical protein